MAKTLPQLLLAMERQGKLLQQLARISFSAASDPDEALRRIVAEGDTLKACVAEARDAFRCAAPESEGRVLVTDRDLKVIGEELARLATAAAALVRYVKEEEGQLQVARSLPPSRPEDHAALGASAVEAAQAEVRHQSTTVVDGVLAVQALLACNPSLDEVVAQPLRSRPRSRRNSPHRPVPSDSPAAGLGNGALVPQSAARSASTSSEGLSDAVATTSPPPRPRLKPNDAPGARPTETIGDVARQYGVTPAVLRRENPHLARFRDDTPLPRGTQVLLPEDSGGHGSPGSDSAAAAGDERWFSAPPGTLQATAAAQGRNPALPEPAMPVAESDEECLASVARSLGIPLAALLAANPQAWAFDPQEPLPEGLTLTIPAPGTDPTPPTPADADAGPSPTTELFPPGASPASTEHRSPPQAQEAHRAHRSEPGALGTRDDAAGPAAPHTNGARYVYGDDEGHAPEPPLSVTPTAHSHRHGAALDHEAHDEAPASPMGTIVAMTPPGPALSLEALSRALGQEPDLVRSLNPDLEDAVPPASPVTLPSPRTAMSPTRGAGPYPATSSDTLRQVAELYGLTTAQLRRANPQYHATADDAPLPLEYHIVLPALPPLAPRPEVPRDPSSSPGTYESPRDGSGIPPPSAAHDVPRRDRSALRHAADEPDEGARAGAQDDGCPFAGDIVGDDGPAPDHVLYEAHAAGRDTFGRGHDGASASSEEGHRYEQVPGGASSRGGVVSETRDADHGDGERHALPSHDNRGPHSMSSSRGQSAEPHAPQQSSSTHGRAPEQEAFLRDDERPPSQVENAFGDQSHQGHADDRDSAPWERPQAQGGAARPAWVPRSATPSDASSSPDDIAADAGGDGADRAQKHDPELRQRGRLYHSEEGHGEAEAEDPSYRRTDASHGARASYPTAARRRDGGDRRGSAEQDGPAADDGARSAGAEGDEERGGSHGTHMPHGTSSSRGPSAEPHAPQRTADHNHTSGRDASARGDAALDGGSEDRRPSGSQASSRGPSAEPHAQVSHRAVAASGPDSPRFGGDRSDGGSAEEGQQYKAADPGVSMEAGYTDASGPVARHRDDRDHPSHDAVSEERQADLPHGHRAAHGTSTRDGRADDAPSAHDAEGRSERDVEEAVAGSEQQCGGETLGDVAYRAGVSESALRRCNPALSAHPPDQPLPPVSALATPDGGVVTARRSGPSGDTTDEEAPLEAYEAWKSPVSQPLDSESGAHPGPGEYGADAGPWAAGTPKGSDAGRPPSPASPFSPRPGDATTPSQPSRGPGVRQAPSPTSTPLPRTSPRPPSRALSLEPAPMDGSGARSAWADHHEDQDHDHPAELLETVPTAAPPPRGSRPTTGSGTSAGRGTAAEATGRNNGSVDAAGVTPPPRVPRGAALDGVVVSPATPVVLADPQPSLVRQPSHPSPEYLSKENDSLQQELVTARRHEDTLQSRLAALRQENDALRRLATQSERGTSPAQSSFSRELSEQPAWVPRPQPRPQPRTNSRIPSPVSQSQRRGSPGPAPGRAAVAAPNTARRPSPVGAPRQAPMPARRAPTPTPRGPPSSASTAAVRPVRRDSAGAASGDDPSPAPAPSAATPAPGPTRGPRAPSARRGSPALSAQPSLVRAGTAHRRSPSPPADPRANAPLPVQLENAILRKRLHDLHEEKARARRSLNPDRAVEALARATRFAPQTSPASRAEARARSGSPAVRGSPLRQGSPVRHGTKVPFYQQQQQQQPAGPRAPAAAPPRAASRERNARLSPSPSLLRREPSSAGRPASSVDNGRWIMPPGRASSPQ